MTKFANAGESTNLVMRLVPPGSSSRPPHTLSRGRTLLRPTILPPPAQKDYCWPRSRARIDDKVCKRGRIHQLSHAVGSTGVFQPAPPYPQPRPHPPAPHHPSTPSAKRLLLAALARAYR